ncbi:CLUMA_CG014421, isoform A [Clunio marinus]|uniref:cathepsin L n=1 Tax=Clunio marinus TaxID=568069 RepID=A0A1J1IMC0_9DIPT|nr:CLUMA_CG014421, isoform A [Clunio marinus]
MNLNFLLVFLSSSIFINFSVGLSTNELREWEKFKVKFEKNYEHSEEDEIRSSLWKKNIEVVNGHNRKFMLGKVSYEMGINKFSDMSEDELKLYTNLKIEKKNAKFERKVTFEPTSKVAAELDWRSRGVVTDVKDQGQCGSCYAFSVTGAVEGQHAIATGKLISLSEQQIVDCTSRYYNYGCGGGYMPYTYNYIRDTGGLDTGNSYPYRGVQQSCRFNRNSIGAKVQSHDELYPTEDTLLKTVASVGPVSVAIHVQGSFYNHRSGVYDDYSCQAVNLNHAVLVVGYGTENGKDYWLVKNSWGKGWGEQGYIKMVRNKYNQCGIASYASVPRGVSDSNKNWVRHVNESATEMFGGIFWNIRMSQNNIDV